jgi:hypothetical protein
MPYFTLYLPAAIGLYSVFYGFLKVWKFYERFQEKSQINEISAVFAPFEAFVSQNA